VTDLLGDLTVDDLPDGEWAIVELFGHVTLVGRIAEIERFGTKMLVIEPLFNKTLLPPVFHGGAAIYRLTPCSAVVAWERQPTQRYELPPTIFATVPSAALPRVEPAPAHRYDPNEEEPF
jgi:hypothetical protein